ncbi:MAG: hypothetical protein WBW84_11570 [Acidobacteriaceae bacterium]
MTGPIALAISHGASVTYEGVVGAEIAEFWPDIGQRLAKRRAAKLAKKQARETAPSN